LLVNPDNPNAAADTAAAQDAASKLGLKTSVGHVRAERELDEVFASLMREGASALFVLSDPLFLSRRERMVELAARHSLPAIYDRRELAAAGGLASYGANFTDAHRLVGVYVGRILKGENPANLPIVQPTKFELVINLRSAKALGLTVPPTLMAQADDVIE
jgi:putative ABC transport system substrate-binding protein